MWINDAELVYIFRNLLPEKLETEIQTIPVGHGVYNKRYVLTDFFLSLTRSQTSPNTSLIYGKLCKHRVQTNSPRSNYAGLSQKYHLGN